MKLKSMRALATQWTPPMLALLAGILLALMIHSNSRLARYSNPISASWLAHGIGALTALLIWWIYPSKTQPRGMEKAPLWSYLGGMPGALAVALAAITVNSPLAMSGTLALGMAGQALLGLAADQWGWFGLPRRALVPRDALTLSLTLAGCAVLIFGA
ncbi:DMT family transporter [Chromobacterium sp. IIBBL 290-4]|uniref:DMT family transporter n=1 Tax=Chromobacterium sp. IIBBL 290-4 TaxID=2953890 RepID=UPI0020B6E499|nr:DMT family transporter [Chromobacterium sp. IIBBL 290-4]UTH72619.1 DMT family transporter [Chromobacterium sp. IIBBL 290-4]